MKCVECGAIVANLYTEYAKDNFRLTQCPKCLNFADKYIEFDYVILTIDVMLLKPQAYRHLLFNSLIREDDKLHRAVMRLGLLLILFDVYLTWFRVERQSQNYLNDRSRDLLIHKSAIIQYLYFLTLCVIETVSFHVSARLLTNWLFKSSENLGTRVSTALLVSSCARVVPVFMVIWQYDIPESAALVDWVVLVYNTEALRVLLDCGYFKAMMITIIGALVRMLCGRAFVYTTVLGQQPGIESSIIVGLSVLRGFLI